MTRAKLALGVLASGSGTNLQALIDACADGTLHAYVAVVICNVPGAACLARAEKVGIPTRLLAHKLFASREAYDAELVAELQRRGVELVCLAGFMRLVTRVLLQAFPDRVLNIHPSLLPAFPGMHAVRQALQASARVSGCTVHFVDEGTDTGPVLLQARVPVLADDTEATLAQRIHAEEHTAYVRAVRLLADGAVALEGEGSQRRARIAEGA